MKVFLSTKNLCLLSFLFLVFFLIEEVGAQNVNPREVCKYMAGNQKRMQWWKEARFGMFIHWGPYAQFAGEYNCTKITEGPSEWIMYHARIPIKEYEESALYFNPLQFNADLWVRIAKEAGMKYMIITAKHCDGFAMYPSKISAYNIVDWTTFKRDPLKEIEIACDRSGIRLGFYYSHNWDWHEPDAMGKDNNWDFPDRAKKNVQMYLEKKALPQVRELVSNYNPHIIWFDVPQGLTEEQSFQFLKAVRKARPDCIINDRIGNRFGDYETPEQFIPSVNKEIFNETDFDNFSSIESDEMFEVCMTLNDTWGYRYYDRNWKSPKTIVQNLVDIVSKGGNYLLNVGPDAQGVIPLQSVRILQEVGKWMQQNGESIYGTTASPIDPLPYNARCTAKDDKLYIHLFEWLEGNRLIIPDICSAINKSYLLADKDRQTIPFVKRDGDVIITLDATKLPFNMLNEYNNVIVLELAEPLRKLSRKILADMAYQTILNRENGELHGDSLKYEQIWMAGVELVNWHCTEDYISWDLRTIRDGKYQLIINYGGSKESNQNKYRLLVGDKDFIWPVENTGGWNNYRSFDLGAIELKERQEYQIKIKPEQVKNETLMNFQSIRLVPILK